MKSGSSFLAMCAILLGTVICAGVVSSLLTSVTRLDIAVILSAMSLLLVLSLLIIPGIMLFRHQRMGGRAAIACVLTAATMMWTLIALGAAAVAMKTPDLGTFLYDAFRPLLALGFFLGLLTTGFGYAHYDTMKR